MTPDGQSLPVFALLGALALVGCASSEESSSEETADRARPTAIVADGAGSYWISGVAGRQRGYVSERLRSFVIHVDGAGSIDRHIGGYDDSLAGYDALFATPEMAAFAGEKRVFGVGASHGEAVIENGAKLDEVPAPPPNVHFVFSSDRLSGGILEHDSKGFWVRRTKLTREPYEQLVGFDDRGLTRFVAGAHKAENPGLKTATSQSAPYDAAILTLHAPTGVDETLLVDGAPRASGMRADGATAILTDRVIARVGPDGALQSKVPAPAITLVLNQFTAVFPRSNDGFVVVHGHEAILVNGDGAIASRVELEFDSTAARADGDSLLVAGSTGPDTLREPAAVRLDVDGRTTWRFRGCNACAIGTVTP